MRLDLFSEGDSVLLLGEGNFSFSVCLHKHNLPIKIVATCFEGEPKYERQRENIEYLRSNKVPVFLNVDATKLRENPLFCGAKFSKIVFNFPHVGGKMKIHLNRELLRNLFQNCAAILADDGLVIVSLCRGQGGTPADRPQRTWHDSWQVTEMAAHGDLVLTAVEPFLRHNFPDYRCIGYRGQDARFHLDGALVHLFAKTPPPYSAPYDSLPPTRLTLVPLRPDSRVLVPALYAELYRRNPLANPRSPVAFLRQRLLGRLGGATRVLEDEAVPWDVGGAGGAPCEVDGVRRSLRGAPEDIFPYLRRFAGETVLFPGTYFRRLGGDFSVAPVEVRFVVMGDLRGVGRFLEDVVELLEGEEVVLWERLGSGCREVVLGRRGTSAVVVAGVFCELGGGGGEVCVVKAQEVCELLFSADWRDIWAERTEVVVGGGRPSLRVGSLYPCEYEFDMTVRYREGYCEERLWEVLWLAAGEVIEGVEGVGEEYRSEEGWSSRSYRLRYRSRDRALFRGRVIEIHSRVVGGAVERGLGVAIG